MSTVAAQQDPHPAAVCRARRRLATVVVEGLDPVGFRISEHLITNTIGTLVLRDDHQVTLRDAGFRSVDVGRNRAEAAADLLTGKAEESAVVEAPPDSSIRGADLHVLVGSHRLPDTVLNGSLEESAAVLPVMVTATGWRVGPLLLQESLVCSHCMGVGRLTERRPFRVFADAGLLGEAAAAVAAQQVAVLIDGMVPCAIAGAGLMADAATGSIELLRHLPGQECACLEASEELAGEELNGL
ncbi:hypothetical protein [Nesterenkonia natronophila]|uniref:THIF-type NAD/FAD binding fold domain-containing protein n=1 Tax=Nesterenkonia natronophila TaxID=2174932 RepID=A0A3A4F1S4_9MICC|nr:hypothetical protein [Nesterenkonia natronophila]RJN31776.1 hypothetical protein D3250_06520 [Nesterenkonia natronophila]